MTVKEMIEKVNAYNEINQVLGLQLKIKLMATISDIDHIEVTSWKEFKKYANDEYVTANEILNYRFYEFDEVAELHYIDAMGYELITTVEFNIYSK